MATRRYTHDEKVAWHNNLPAKRMASHMLCWDERGNLLFVLHNYEDTWDLPGGVVEENESPMAAAIRETEEEVGLVFNDRRVKFVGVDYAHHMGEWKDFVHFYFNAGVLKPKEIKQIGEKAYSLHSYQFLSRRQAAGRVTPQRFGGISAMFTEGARQGIYLETKMR